MAYFVNGTDGNITAVVEDGAINTDTSLKLIGIGYPQYAETVAENFVGLLENFSSPNAPSNPIKGQAWFNTSINQLQVFDGDIFRAVNNVKVSDSEPFVPREGDFWYDSINKQMFFRRGAQWQLIAPAYSKDQGRTEFVAEWITDESDVQHVVLTLFNNGKRALIIGTDDKFRTHMFNGFSWINPGINIPNYLQKSSGVFWAGNGNAYAESGLTVGGLSSQIQYNSNGFLGGANITTNGNDLTSTLGTFQSKNMIANEIKSLTTGYIFPDNTTQTTAAIIDENTVSGYGDLFSMAYFDDTNDANSISGTPQIRTDGRNLTMTDGMLSVNNILLTPASGDVLNGIAFADGSIQYSAATNNLNAVNNSGGSATQLAYYNDSTHIKGASQITTNGTDLTMQQGQLRVADLTLYGSIHNAGKITFSDGSIQTTAPVAASQVQADWNVTNTSLPGYIKNKPSISSTIQVSYPTSITPNSTFSWGVIRGVANETWYATTNLPAPYNRIPSSGTYPLDNEGATSYTNGNFGANTGDVEVIFNFSQSGKIIKRLRISSTIQVSYPTTITQGGQFSWGVTNGVSNETWYATTNLPAPYNRIPSTGTYSLNNAGSISYTNGSYGNSIGDVELTFHFSESGTVVKRLSIIAPSVAPTLPGYGEVGSYTMTSGVSNLEVYTKYPGDNFLPGPVGCQWRQMGSGGGGVTVEAQSHSYDIIITLWVRIA
jgi:hypothetical protein